MNLTNKTIELYDTTLRDGTQGEHINLSVQDKLLIAEKLDDFGVDYIEGGWPSSNPKDEEFFTPRIVMQRCWASSTTPTPRGFSFLKIVSAI